MKSKPQVAEVQLPSGMRRLPGERANEALTLSTLGVTGDQSSNGEKLGPHKWPPPDFTGGCRDHKCVD